MHTPVSKVMDARATAYLKRTIIRIINSPPMLARLLWQSGDLQGDLEWQYTTIGPNEVQIGSIDLRALSSNPGGPTQPPSHTEDHITGNIVPTNEMDTDIEVHDVLTRLVVHDNGVIKQHPVLITGELVNQMQEVLDAEEKLRVHEKQYQGIEKEIMEIQRSFR